MLTGLIGTGNAILLAGLALIIKKFRGHVPGKHSDNALLTLAIVLMVFAGAEFGLVGIGQWIVSAAHAVEAWAGPVGAVIVALVILSTFLGVLAAIVFTAHEGALTVAFMVPLLCAIPNHGYPAQFIAAIRPPAEQVALVIRAKMGA